MKDAEGFETDAKVRTRAFKIGCVGAGMIMAERHLAAYKEAGFPVVAVGSRTKPRAEKVAERWGVPKAHDTPHGVIENRDVAILDLAFPPISSPRLFAARSIRIISKRSWGAGPRRAELRSLPQASCRETREYPGGHRTSHGGRRAARQEISRREVQGQGGLKR